MKNSLYEAIFKNYFSVFISELEVASKNGKKLYTDVYIFAGAEMSWG